VPDQTGDGGPDDIVGDAGPADEPDADSEVIATTPTLTKYRHTLTHDSEVPGHEGELVELVIREVVRNDKDDDPDADWNGWVVVFVHGATYGGTSLYDVPGLSSLEIMAEAGFAAYAFDLSGYGRSWHPPIMDDTCSFSQNIRELLGLSCAPKRYETTTTSGSDLDDLYDVVSFITARRDVSRVHLWGTSLGGSRAIYFAREHGELVDRVATQGTSGSGVLGQTDPPAQVPAFGVPMNGVTENSYRERMADDPCSPSLVDADVVDAFWADLLAADPLAASWGDGLARYPSQVLWGNSTEVISEVTAPILVAGSECDNLAAEPGVRALYDTLGSTDKVRVNMAGGGHAMILQSMAPLLLELTIEWLRDGQVDGRTTGAVDVALDGTRIWQ
ncbi:MAG: alpha/beta fold hydrolase, partial [Myxococcota bacterium]